MAKGNEILKEEDKVNLTPMIDVVFLLLIYFMVTTTLIKTEADMGIKLPAPNPDVNIDPPEEYFIIIQKNDLVMLDNQPVGSPGDRLLPQLKALLFRLKTTAEAIPGGKIMVTIAPEQDARHGRIIDVLNVLSDVKIKTVTFANTDVEGG